MNTRLVHTVSLPVGTPHAPCRSPLCVLASTSLHYLRLRFRPVGTTAKDVLIDTDRSLVPDNLS